MPELKVTNSHLDRDAYLLFASRHLAKCWRTPKAHSVNTPWGIGLWPRDGPGSKSM